MGSDQIQVEIIATIKDLQRTDPSAHTELTVRILCAHAVGRELQRQSRKIMEHCRRIPAAAPDPDETQYESWKSKLEQTEYRYMRMADRRYGCTSVQPQSEYILTMNRKEWLCFARLYSSPHVHPQIREIAELLSRELAQRVPAR